MDGIADPSSKSVTFSGADDADNDTMSFNFCVRTGLNAANLSINASTLAVAVSFDSCVRVGLGAVTLSMSALTLAIATSFPTSIAFNSISFAIVLIASTAFLPLFFEQHLLLL